LSLGIDAIASARTAALADPDGESLVKCLAEIAQARDAYPSRAPSPSPTPRQGELRL